MKHFKAIAAMSPNRVIGAGNKIPWHLPEDFRWFKKMTTGHVVVMGRKTFESLGRPLPHRINIVLTRHPIRLRRQHPELFGGARADWAVKRVRSACQLPLPRVETAGPVDVRLLTDFRRIVPSEVPVDVFICGGAHVYEQALPLCSDLFLTLVKRTVDGDAFFPEFEDRFAPVAVLMSTPEFDIVHYRNRGLGSSRPEAVLAESARFA